MNELICQHPWFDMWIDSKQTVGCCCVYQDKLPVWNLKVNFDILSYWNSDFYKKVRGIVASKKLNNTGCNLCEKAFENYTLLYDEIPPDLNQKQHENFLKARNNYINKRIVVDHYPVKYPLVCGFNCNIKCWMCAQLELKSNKNMLPTSLLMISKSIYPMQMKFFFVEVNPLFCQFFSTF